jgi:hypothetical protein
MIGTEGIGSRDAVRAANDRSDANRSALERRAATVPRPADPPADADLAKPNQEES